MEKKKVLRVLLDECCPKRLKSKLSLPGMECMTVREAGYSGKMNGELIALIDGVFDALVTIDQNLKYQQRITGRKITIVVVGTPSNDMGTMSPYIAEVREALSNLKPGEFVEVGWVRPARKR